MSRLSSALLVLYLIIVACCSVYFIVKVEMMEPRPALHLTGHRL